MPSHDAATTTRWKMKRAWEGTRDFHDLLVDGWEPFHVKTGVRDGRVTGTLIWLRKAVEVDV